MINDSGEFHAVISRFRFRGSMFRITRSRAGAVAGCGRHTVYVVVEMWSATRTNRGSAPTKPGPFRVIGDSVPRPRRFLAPDTAMETQAPPDRGAACALRGKFAGCEANNAASRRSFVTRLLSRTDRRVADSAVIAHTRVVRPDPARFARGALPADLGAGQGFPRKRFRGNRRRGTHRRRPLGP
jgi:hypothetical protein